MSLNPQSLRGPTSGKTVYSRQMAWEAKMFTKTSLPKRGPLLTTLRLVIGTLRPRVAPPCPQSSHTLCCLSCQCHTLASVPDVCTAPLSAGGLASARHQVESHLFLGLASKQSAGTFCAPTLCLPSPDTQEKLPVLCWSPPLSPVKDLVIIHHLWNRQFSTHGWIIPRSTWIYSRISKLWNGLSWPYIPLQGSPHFSATLQGTKFWKAQLRFFSVSIGFFGTLVLAAPPAHSRQARCQHLAEGPQVTTLPWYLGEKREPFIYNQVPLLLLLVVQPWVSLFSFSGPWSLHLYIKPNNGPYFKLWLERLQGIRVAQNLYRHIC